VVVVMGVCGCWSDEVLAVVSVAMVVVLVLLVLVVVAGGGWWLVAGDW
jgi:hypothetical protein